MNKKGLFVLPIIMSSMVGCNNNQNDSGFSVDKSLVYGITDLSYQEHYKEGKSNFRYTHKLFKNMGVKSVRLWMHCDWFMNGPDKYIDENVEKLTAIYNDLKNEGYQIIAMNHSNFHKNFGSVPNVSSSASKPPRNLEEGSQYMVWLQNLETTYFNMVSKFPDIEYWEIDNECNNDDFMAKIGGGTFTLEEKAQVYYDMMYYASKGIHRANANAKTVMGGLIVSNATTFLKYIYDLIESGNSWSKNPDDYFQVACWHPYMETFTKKKFIDLNDSIYSVIKEREKKDKKVFLTEMGFSENNGISLEDQSDFIKKAYDACKNDLYYVESLHYFRMFDDYITTWGSDAEKTFGLFYDPNKEKEVDGEVVSALGQPKITAYAYQEAAGGTGPLDIYQKFLAGDLESKLVMHRGYSSKHRENTLDSFNAAGDESDVYAIESDVWLTKDNKPIMIHDNNTSRVTNNKYNLEIKNSTFDQLRSIRLPDSRGNPDVHQIPSLEEYCNVLKSKNKVGFLELKENFSKDQLNIIFNIIKGIIPLTQIVAISFNFETLVNLRELYSEIELFQLANRFTDLNLNELKKYNIGADVDANTNPNNFTENNLNTLMSQGIKSAVWTIDDKTTAVKWGRLSVDYVTTNCVNSFKD